MLVRIPDARWLPSRSHFAISRLYAYLRLSRGRAATDEVPTAYAVDRQQNAIENFTVSLLVLIATTCYLAAALDTVMPLPLAFLVSLVAAPVVLHLPFFAIGLLVMPAWRIVSRKNPPSNVPATSFGTMALLFAVSVWYALEPGWPRVVAIATLSLFVLNAIAAAVVLLRRDRIAELEKRCGA